MLSVSVGLIHPTGLFGVEQGKHPSVLVNFQLANENAVSSLPGTGEEASLGLQSWWDTPLEIPPMILYVPGIVAAVSVAPEPDLMGKLRHGARAGRS